MPNTFGKGYWSTIQYYYNLMYRLTICIVFVTILLSCSDRSSTDESGPVNRIPIIIDTDANNELDDQHALAYLFFNDEYFDIRGVTTNATFNGGDIKLQTEEARRIMKLCNVPDTLPLLEGANGDFDSILTNLDEAGYDGQAAVDFMIEEARKEREEKLVLLPVGKLTNVALAIYSAPDIVDNIRIVWLGANYPEPGEYNLVNDIPAMNYILNREVEFQMVMVRYGKPSGSDAVRVTPEEVRQKLAGKGPTISDPVTGRHGDQFNNFGDYSVSLFENIDLHGDPPSRALFDMVAVAILKNPDWGETNIIPAPIMRNEVWEERPENPRQIVIWENFDKEAILKDFFGSIP